MQNTISPTWGPGPPARDINPWAWELRVMSSTSCFELIIARVHPQRRLKASCLKSSIFTGDDIRADSLQLPAQTVHPQRYTHSCTPAALTLWGGCLDGSPLAGDIVAVTTGTRHNTFSRVSQAEPQHKQTAVSAAGDDVRPLEDEGVCGLPRNFFGGLLRSPASGWTTQRSSTKLWAKKK